MKEWEYYAKIVFLTSVSKSSQIGRFSLFRVLPTEVIRKILSNYFENLSPFESHVLDDYNYEVMNDSEYDENDDFRSMSTGGYSSEAWKMIDEQFESEE